jgi:hypothetical protein
MIRHAMKSEHRPKRAEVTRPRRLLMALVSIAFLTVAIVPVAEASVENPNVIPPGGQTFGQSYGAWSAAWWQYVLSQPASTNPLLDGKGQQCGLAQSGPVFFLVGTTSGKAVRNKCVVPQGKALFFPVANAFDVHTPKDGLSSAQKVWNDLHITFGLSFSDLHATIDGVPVNNLDVSTSPYRACAGPVLDCAPSFSLTLPTDNILAVPRGTYSPAVADGYYLMLSPLLPGDHTITFGGSGHLGGAFSTDTTYHLIVSAT